MGSLTLDLRSTLRGLRRRGGTTAAIVVTLALGIGANTAIFSVVKAVLIEPLPYRQADRLTFLWSDLTQADYQRAPLSGPELDDFRRLSKTHDDFAAIWASSATLIADERPDPLRVGMVSANFLSLLGVEPVLGRWLEAGDEGEGVPPRVVLSGDLWQRRFGGDEGLVGRALRIDGGWGVPGGLYTVVGIMPPGFEMLLPSDASVPRRVDVWLPFQHDLPSSNRGSYYLRTVGRLAPGATLEQAEQEIAALGQELESSHDEYAASGRAFYPVSLQGDGVSGVRPALLALLGGTVFVLLIACANVAHLLLARAAERRREISLRAALGAGGRIARQLMVESLLLAAAGAAAGIALAYGLLEALASLRPDNLPRLEAVTLDSTVLGVSSAVAVACGLLFGMAPVWESLRLDLARALRSGGGDERQRNRTHGALVVAEVALAIVLVTGAGLLVRSFMALQEVDPGFDDDGVLTFQVSLPAARYDSPVKIGEFTRQLDHWLGALPGVLAAGAINQLPLSDLPNWSTAWRTRRTADAEESREADARVVTPGYLRAVDTRLVAGRFFDDGDDLEARRVVIVDELLARQAWPGEAAVGQEIEVRLWSGRGFQPVWTEVVGVVSHVRHHQLSEEVRGQMFAPFAQGPRNQVGVAVRAAGDPLSLVGPAREQIAEIDPDLALADVRAMADYVTEAGAGHRVRMALGGALAVLAVVLALLGLYSVLALAITSRRREIGIRLAIGGLPSDVVRLFLAHGLRWVVAGTALGLGASLVVNRWLESLLYQVSADDPATLLTVPALLIALAWAACYFPARQASRIDPIRTLRSE